MSWLPTVSLQETTICLHDGEAKGWLIELVWFGWFFQISVARKAARPL